MVDHTVRRQLKLAAEKYFANLEAENERLRAAERKAFNAGFWAFAAPANDREFESLKAAEQQAWDERAATDEQKGPT